MTISLKHATQAVGTYPDDGELGVTEWNEEHALTMSADYILGRATAGTGAVEEIPCTAAGRALLDDVSAAAQRTTLGLGTSATYDIGTSGANVPLLNGDNTWTGTMRVGDGTGIAYMRMNGAAGYDRGLYLRSANVNRWFMGGNSSAETGSNVGTDFSIWRHDDTGTYIDTPFLISRSSGKTYLISLGLDTPLAVAEGGTGATDAATARTNLGLAIGTDVQAYDADLSAIAALAGTSGILTKTGANTWALDTSTYLTSLGIGSLTQAWDADLDAFAALGATGGFIKKTGAAAYTIDTSTYLTTGDAASTYQPLDADLTAIAALTSAADKMPYATGAGTWALADLTAAGRALLDDANASAQRTTLGLGTSATYNIGTSGANVPLMNASNVWTGGQNFGDGTGSYYLDIDGAAGSNRAFRTMTAGIVRWTFNCSTSAETGANAGSDFELYRHDDAGAYIDTPWQISRSTGNMHVKSLTLGTDLAVSQGGTGVSTLTGIVKGNGTSAFSAAVAGTDYVAPSALSSYATLASPALTGTPTAPSAAAYTDSSQIATTAYVYDTVTTVPENAQTGTSYTLVLADAGKMVTLNNAASITLTIPTNASVAFPIGTRIDIAQFGAGQVTVGGASVTIRSSGSKLKLTGQYSGATLWKKGTDEWLLVGDIAA